METKAFAVLVIHPSQGIEVMSILADDHKKALNTAAMICIERNQPNMAIVAAFSLDEIKSISKNLEKAMFIGLGNGKRPILDDIQKNNVIKDNIKNFDFDEDIEDVIEELEESKPKYQNNPFLNPNYNNSNIERQKDNDKDIFDTFDSDLFSSENNNYEIDAGNKRKYKDDMTKINKESQSIPQTNQNTYQEQEYTNNNKQSNQNISEENKYNNNTNAKKTLLESYNEGMAKINRKMKNKKNNNKNVEKPLKEKSVLNELDLSRGNKVFDQKTDVYLDDFYNE